MPYSAKEAQEIVLRAKRALGQMQKQDAGARRIFMEQCISDLTESGDAEDDDDARDICEMLWQEGGDLGDFGE